MTLFKYIFNQRRNSFLPFKMVEIRKWRPGGGGRGQDEAIVLNSLTDIFQSQTITLCSPELRGADSGGLGVYRMVPVQARKIPNLEVTYMSIWGRFPVTLMSLASTISVLYTLESAPVRNWPCVKIAYDTIAKNLMTYRKDSESDRL